MIKNPFTIIDISQPVDSKSACFPGDIPFSKDITLTYKDSGIVNLTAFTMSPHVGTHADSAVHIKGTLSDNDGFASDLPLQPFIGDVYVLALNPHTGPIEPSSVREKLESLDPFPSRILFKTRHQIRYDVFDDYSYISCDLAKYLAENSVRLIGLDTPSVDHTESRDLPSHNLLLEGGLVWLENLDLTKAEEGSYTLVALPLKFTELEASPVRAVLLSSQ